MVVSPASANVRAGGSTTFSAVVKGTQDSAVSWLVNNAAGGSSSLGTIDASGKYVAPATLPSSNALTIKAVSSADSSVSSTSAVTLLNPTPVLTGISPSSTNLGNYTLTLTGSEFVAGAQVHVGGTILSTTFVSSTKLTATVMSLPQAPMPFSCKILIRAAPNLRWSICRSTAPHKPLAVRGRPSDKAPA